MIGRFLVAALGVASAPVAAQQPAATEIEATVIAMWDAIEREDIEAYASFIHPDFTAFGEGDVYLAEGRDLEMRSIENWLERLEGWV